MTRRITLVVNPTDLFDRLATNHNLRDALGERLIGALLAKTGFIDAVGLAMYGITLDEDTDDGRPAPSTD